MPQILPQPLQDGEGGTASLIQGAGSNEPLVELQIDGISCGAETDRACHHLARREQRSESSPRIGDQYQCCVTAWTVPAMVPFCRNAGARELST